MSQNTQSRMDDGLTSQQRDFEFLASNADKNFQKLVKEDKKHILEADAEYQKIAGLSYADLDPTVMMDSDGSDY